MTRAAVIDYDLGNLPSVTQGARAHRRRGIGSSTSADQLDGDFDAIVLPGVGHFGAGARNLRDRGFDTALQRLGVAGKPLLGICVGLQLFMESLGGGPRTSRARHRRRWRASACRRRRSRTWDGTPSSDQRSRVRSRRSSATTTWRTSSTPSTSRRTNPSSPRRRRTTRRSAAVVEQDNVVGVQFHPEKSADVGRRVLEAFFERRSRSDVRGNPVHRSAQGSGRPSRARRARRRRPCSANDPVDMAIDWEGQGAPRLHVVDLDGAVSGDPANASAIGGIIKRLAIPVQVAGGIRTIEAAEDWLAAGADRVVIGTKALTRRGVPRARRREARRSPRHRTRLRRAVRCASPAGRKAPART